MSQIINAHFDGRVLIPDEPVQLPVGTPLVLRVDIPEAAAPRFFDLLQFAADLPDAPGDLAAQHDHYLYGSPKQ
ncbi:MAG: antitoxin family protein [Planctomycetes bacterium]|nr:antitoxin family protein [Planctomycetota bacterium]